MVQTPCKLSKYQHMKMSNYLIMDRHTVFDLQFSGDNIQPTSCDVASISIHNSWLIWIQMVRVAVPFEKLTHFVCTNQKRAANSCEMICLLEFNNLSFSHIYAVKWTRHLYTDSFRQKRLQELRTLWPLKLKLCHSPSRLFLIHVHVYRQCDDGNSMRCTHY